MDLEPQLGGGCSEATGSGGDSTQGAQVGTPPQGASPGRSRKTIYNLQVASASRLHTPQRDEGQGVGSSEKVGVCVPHSETQASQGTMLEEVCSGLTRGPYKIVSFSFPDGQSEPSHNAGGFISKGYGGSWTKA